MKLKRFVSVVLSLIMLLSVCTMGAFAEETPSHTDEDVAKVVMYGIIETTNELIGLKVGDVRKLEYTVGDIQLNVTYKDGVSETLTYTPSLPEKAKVTFYTHEYYVQKSDELESKALIDGNVVDENAHKELREFCSYYYSKHCDALELTEDGSFKAVKSGYDLVKFGYKDISLYYSVEYAEEDYQAIRDKYANAEVTVDKYPKTSLPVDVYGAVYRLYNPNSGEHLYTASSYEMVLLGLYGWKNEGIGWYAPTRGTVVYRLYNPNAGDHHYTTDINEVNYLVSQGWRAEGEVFCSAKDGGNAIYRRYNPNAVAGAHLFTANLEEANYIVSLGWRNEGVAFYGY